MAMKCGLRQSSRAYQALLCDPQTSGGLLVACAPDAVAAALGIFRRHGLMQAAVIGAMTDAEPLVYVEA